MTGVLCLEHDCLIKSHLLLLEEIEGQCESLIETMSNVLQFNAISNHIHVASTSLCL